MEGIGYIIGIVPLVMYSIGGYHTYKRNKGIK
jgi:hypothetical protein